MAFDASRRDRFLLVAFSTIALLVLPLVLQSAGNFWVRIADFALLYVLLALGLNIVVGYAGLLDLGYIAFYAVGAYTFGLLASPHLTEEFAWFKNHFSGGMHVWIWAAIPLGAFIAGGAGVLLGTPISSAASSSSRVASHARPTRLLLTRMSKSRTSEMMPKASQ